MCFKKRILEENFKTGALIGGLLGGVPAAAIGAYLGDETIDDRIHHLENLKHPSIFGIEVKQTPEVLDKIENELNKAEDYRIPSILGTGAILGAGGAAAGVLPGALLGSIYNWDKKNSKEIQK